MKYYITTLVVALFIVIAPSTASACSFLYQEPQEWYDQNDFVFIGTVTETEDDGNINGTRTVTFGVERVYKGSVGEEVTVTTGANSAMCGFDEGVIMVGDIWVIQTSDLQSINSLPGNQKYDSLGEAEDTLDLLAGTDPVICTTDWNPVCGQIDTGIRCVTTPCPSFEEITYSNSCRLEAAGADFLYEGECVLPEEAVEEQEVPELPVDPIVEKPLPPIIETVEEAAPTTEEYDPFSELLESVNQELDNAPTLDILNGQNPVDNIEDGFPVLRELTAVFERIIEWFAGLFSASSR